MGREKDFVIENGILEKYVGDAETIVLPEGIISIGNKVFYDCTTLKHITISNGVKKIGESAFDGCLNLSEVVFSEKLESIEDSAFSCCGKLVSIDLPNNLISIGDKAFSFCHNLKTVVIPDGVKHIGKDAFNNCFNLRDIKLPEKLEELNLNFSNVSCLEVPENVIIRNKHNINISLSNIKTSTLGCAYISLFQNATKRKNWNNNRTADNPSEEFGYMITILEEQNLINATTGFIVAEFILKYYKNISPERIKYMLSLYKNIKCKSISQLEDYKDFIDYMNGCEEGASEESDVEVFLKNIEINNIVAQAVKEGLHWKSREGLCLPDVLVRIISYYAQEWDRCAVTYNGMMGDTTILKDGTLIQTNMDVDHVANIIDKGELSELLTKLVNSAKYRLYILAWARYASEEHVEEQIATLKKLSRGKMKDQYRACNLQQALMISETRSAMKYFDKHDVLERYARMRGVSVMELRNTKMLPELGFDKDGVRKFDIGDNIIEVRINKEFTFDIYDTNMQKSLRAFPKIGGDDGKIGGASKEYNTLKKEVLNLVKQIREQLGKMYISGETVTAAGWKNIYLEHPVIHYLAESIIWMDDAGKTFFVKNGEIFTSEMQNYEPQGEIHIAHVLEMSSEDIAKWQSIIKNNEETLILKQICEPKIHYEWGKTEKKYEGFVIDLESRKLIKDNLQNVGIEVYSGLMNKQYDTVSKRYEFGNKNTLYIGKCVSIYYDIRDDESIVFERVFVEKNYNARELNCILTALEKACIVMYINNDDYMNLSYEILELFVVNQIEKFIDVAIKLKSNNCLAILMDFKNNKFSSYNPTNKYTLD